MKLELPRILSNLAKYRPIFHSEADFQLALAWEIHQRYPDARVRLEYKPFADERIYADLWVSLGDAILAAELKYHTLTLSALVDGESFSLSNQGAQKDTRQRMFQDLWRLERISATVPNSNCFAIFLTNDAAFWKPASRLDTKDAAYRMTEGRELSPKSTTDAGYQMVTLKGVEMRLTGSYVFSWLPFSKVNGRGFAEFRYLLVPTHTNPR